jgi:hypothetical protein
MEYNGSYEGAAPWTIYRPKQIYDGELTPHQEPWYGARVVSWFKGITFLAPSHNVS